MIDTLGANVYWRKRVPAAVLMPTPEGGPAVNTGSAWFAMLR